MFANTRGRVFVICSLVTIATLTLASKEKFDAADAANTGKNDFSKVDKNAAPTDRHIEHKKRYKHDRVVICPVLAAGLAAGDIPIFGPLGHTTAWDLIFFIRRLGFSKQVAEEFTNPHKKEGIELYNMEGNLKYEHGTSSGIRDPVPDETKFAKLLEVAHPEKVYKEDAEGHHGDTLSKEELQRAGRFFDANPNDKGTEGKGAHVGGKAETTFGLLAETFGVHHHVVHHEDRVRVPVHALKSLFINGTYPKGFKLRMLENNELAEHPYENHDEV